jgi:hypothetical protein
MLSWLVAWLIFLEPAMPTPPAPLACLARHYQVAPVWRNQRWYARVSGGVELPFEDGREKSPADRIDHPDLEDMFAVPYRKGPLLIPDREEDDPGRARVEAFFAAIYPTRGGQIQPVDFLGRKVKVHARARAAFVRVEERLRGLLRARQSLRSQLFPIGGGYVDRPIAGTNRKSAHAYGIAIDINPSRSAYWRWRKSVGGKSVPANVLPDPAIVEAFEAEGFIWGGRWYHFDTMHFEYRPELLDPACAATP